MSEPAGVEPPLRAYAANLDDGTLTALDTPESVRDFTDYSEEWTAALAEKRRELARLTQLLDAAQRDRDEAQADASMYAGVIEAFREVAIDLRDYDDSADPNEPRPWQKYFAGRVLALLDEMPNAGVSR